MSTLEDIAAILDDAQEQIYALQTLHDEALDKEAARPRFRARVKSVLEQERSALDYLAVEITKVHGTPKGLIYYPLAQSAQGFPVEMEKKMPGVAAAAPKVATAIEKWQPYQPGGEWLRNLNQLAREQKHNRLTLQLVRDTIRCRVTEDATGAFVEWYGLTFRPGPNPGITMIDSQSGPIIVRLEPNRPDTAPKPFWVGTGPTGIEVFGVPIDLATQRPMLDARLTVESRRMSRWFFILPHHPVDGFPGTGNASGAPSYRRNCSSCMPVTLRKALSRSLTDSSPRHRLGACGRNCGWPPPNPPEECSRSAPTGDMSGLKNGRSAAPYRAPRRVEQRDGGAPIQQQSTATPPDSNEHELPPTPCISWDNGQTPSSASSSG